LADWSKIPLPGQTPELGQGQGINLNQVLPITNALLNLPSRRLFTQFLEEDANFNFHEKLSLNLLEKILER
jgi:hypothetical protein